MIEINTMVGTGMKVVCQREGLVQKLGIVARAVSTRASVQILSGVLLRAEGGRLQARPSTTDAQAALTINGLATLFNGFMDAARLRRRPLDYRSTGRWAGGPVCGC